MRWIRSLSIAVLVALVQLGSVAHARAPRAAWRPVYSGTSRSVSG
jgi:hypothetical protein